MVGLRLKIAATSTPVLHVLWFYNSFGGFLCFYLKSRITTEN